MSKPQKPSLINQAAASYERRDAAMRAAWPSEIQAFAIHLEAVIMVAVRLEQAQRAFGWSDQKVAEMAGVPLEDIVRIKAHDETVPTQSQVAVLTALRSNISGA